MSGLADIASAAAPAIAADVQDGIAITATATLAPVKYPNRLEDIAALGRTGNWRRSFLLRPKFAGRFVLLLYPKDHPAIENVLQEAVHFPAFNSAPKVVEMRIPPELRYYQEWEWRLVKTTFDDDDNGEFEQLDAASRPGDGMLDGAAAAALATDAQDSGSITRLIFDVRPAMTGRIAFGQERDERRSRTLLWSCHQPYHTQNGGAAVHPDSENILNWYRQEAERFEPHQVWALGDTAYSDGIGPLNFVRQVDGQSGWHNNYDLRKDLLSLYRLGYRYHWSFEPMQAVMRQFPHLAMWDDHELRDGYGSESTDFSDENRAMKEVASQAAEEYLFSWNTRLRSESSRNVSVDNHQAYVDGPVAAFIFDGRNSRNYGDDLPIAPDAPLIASALFGLLTGGVIGAAMHASVTAVVEKQLIDLYRWNNPGEVISTQQLDDFARYCSHIRGQPGVKYLLLGNSVPFIYINDLVESLMSELELAASDVAHGVRDDIRDSWHSPGNRRQLSRLIQILRDLHQARPDMEIINLSGDIHLSNAFVAQPEGFSKPIYQITSSALTNRGTLSEDVAGLLAVDGPLDVLSGGSDLGDITRLWQEAKHRNFLSIDATQERIVFHLHVYNPNDEVAFGERDKRLTIASGVATVEG